MNKEFFYEIQVVIKREFLELKSHLWKYFGLMLYLIFLQFSLVKAAVQKELFCQMKLTYFPALLLPVVLLLCLS